MDTGVALLASGSEIRWSLLYGFAACMRQGILRAAIYTHQEIDWFHSCIEEA